MTATAPTPQSEAEDHQSDELKPGTELLHGQYVIEGFLNAGGFGVTYLAKDSLDRTVVIKECYPAAMVRRTASRVRARAGSSQDEFDSIVRLFEAEALRLSKLQHPNIVGIHQVFQDYGTAYMALDFVKGKDMLDVIEEGRDTLPPYEVKRILVKVLDAMTYVHANDVLHRDISPDNILLAAGNEPVLIDFGAAREEATRKTRALSAIHVVKDGYSPNEFYLAGNQQNASSDLYSLAATFYHVIIGAPPPNSQTRVAAIAAGRQDPYEPLQKRVEGYDEHFLKAIDTALNVFPKDRIQSAQEWLEQIDTEKRKQAAQKRVSDDREMELSIQRIVAETNLAVMAERAKAERDKKRNRFAIKALAKPKNSLLLPDDDPLRDPNPPPEKSEMQKRHGWFGGTEDAPEDEVAYAYELEDGTEVAVEDMPQELLEQITETEQAVAEEIARQEAETAAQPPRKRSVWQRIFGGGETQATAPNGATEDTSLRGTGT
ncbi:MAG: serine/threonine-protein kinase [Pseudomonadota bacterium]